MTLSINLHTATGRLPLPLATARRIAEVAGFLNEDLKAEVTKDMLSGRVDAHDMENELIIKWWPSSMVGVLEYHVGVGVGSTKTMNELVASITLNDMEQWRKFSAVVGNIIIDQLKHGNTGVPKAARGDSQDDPDFDLSRMQKHFIKNVLTDEERKKLN